MRASFGNGALVQHQDEIGMTNRTQAMGDDNLRTIECADVLLDDLFRHHVQGAGGLIQQNDQMIDERAGLGQTLAFAILPHVHLTHRGTTRELIVLPLESGH